MYQQAQRWLAAGCFEALVDDLRAVLRLADGRAADPANKQAIVADDKLRAVFGRDRCTLFERQGLLSPHLTAA